MSTHRGSGKEQAGQPRGMSWRLAPMARAIAVLMAAGGVVGGAHAQRAFSAGWMAQKNLIQNNAMQTGRLANGMPASMLTSPQGQQQRANEQLNRSISNLNLAARGIAAQQAAQAAARRAAGNDPSVPDGLAEGGLEIDTHSLTAGWHNANAPVQTQVDGRTNVAIQQAGDKAILNWETFNVGRNTTVDFKQDPSWAVLNKVNDPQARPSQIQGQIKADGTVLIANRNGVVFSGTSQVDTRNLVAAAAKITDDQFRGGGVYGSDTNASFTDALGKVEVQAGAQISTRTPQSATQGGGYVMLLGSEVHNAGQISTPSGQTVLAAGDSFFIRKGVGSTGNQLSTTRGNEVTPAFGSDSLAGKVVNSGLIQAPLGDVTLTGREVRQDGVVLSSTSVNTRGTVHLKAIGDAGTVTLGAGSTTAIVLDTGNATALDSQRAGLMAPVIDSTGDIIAAGNDRRDLSRIEIGSGGTADFKGGSLTLATGGQVMVDAKRRSLVREGALIDVSGAIGVKVSMESNNVKVNIQGNEQRDAPINRDGKSLNNNDVWIDRRSLVFVPKGTNGYSSDRWYTAGGLLEVSGYLGTQGHTVGEWMAQGGIVQFSGNDVVTQSGSLVNLSGGTLDVQTGFLKQSWLKGSDGRLYEVSRAPGDLLYKGLYKGFEDEHARWGKNTTDYFYNPLIGPQRRLESGYTAGRDAGVLVIGTKSAVLEGEIAGDTFQGSRQTQAAQAALDGYNQSQQAVARRGQLVVGSYVPYYVKSSGSWLYGLSANADTPQNVVIAEEARKIAAGLGLDGVLPDDRGTTLYLDSAQLSGFELGGIRIAAGRRIAVEGALQMAPAGEITLYGPQVEVKADLRSAGGTIRLGNVLEQVSSNLRVEDTILAAPNGVTAGVTVADGVRIDTQGLWSNLLKDPADIAALPYRNGGRVSLRSTGDVALAQGSLIDVSSGAAIMSDASVKGGKGGDITLQAGRGVASASAGTEPVDGVLSLQGQLRAHGVAGGGTLDLQTARVLIGGAPDAPAELGTLRLDSDFFTQGFSAYKVVGEHGTTVADGAQVEARMPVFRLVAGAKDLPTGSPSSAALEVWTPPLYQEDPTAGVLTRRAGASLTLQAGDADTTASSTTLLIGRDARVAVDPGQSIVLRSAGQLTVDGRLEAWGGRIELGSIAAKLNADEAKGLSAWIGEHAVLDVAARAATAVDVQGRRYGLVGDGGQIVIGGEVDPRDGSSTAVDRFVVLREGALLDASGAQAVLDVPGQGRTAVASHGGSISLGSTRGLYLDGEMRALAGGAGAAGGHLSVSIANFGVIPETPAPLRQIRELVLGQGKVPSALAAGVGVEVAADRLQYGHARLGADQVSTGGFDTLTLHSGGMIAFDGSVSLSLGQALNLYAGSLGWTDAAVVDSRVKLAAPSIRLAASALADNPSGSRIDWLGMHYGDSRLNVSQQPPVGSLSLEAGRLLDVRGGQGLGSGGRLTIPGVTSADDPLIDRRGIGQIALRSGGDLRIDSGTVYAPGDLTLAAAQIYPVTGAAAKVYAGWRGNIAGFDPERTLSLARTTDELSELPYSVFGSLTLGAAVIDQGGVLRAPLGALYLGVNKGGDEGSITRAVNLLEGSETSVSAAGLVMPYGGTSDGVAWQYAGEQVKLQGVGTAGSVRLLGQHVDVREGATIDLSGGGTLAGAGFVSGRGGSTDARFNPLMQISSKGFTLPGLGSNPVYAIVPGKQASQAPLGGEAGAVDPVVGQQITIGAGVPGLPAGTYTLMPSTYALLPGAFRVEINGAGGLREQGVPAVPIAMRNRSWSTSGRLSVAGTSIGDSLASQVILTPADVLRTYSQYNETSYSDFVRTDAARLGVPRAQLEADAKALLLELADRTANPQELSFRFEGTVRGEPAKDGFGSTLAVLGNTIEILGDRSVPGMDYGVALQASDLSKVDVNRIAIGGMPLAVYGQGGNLVRFDQGGTPAGAIVMRSGATLAAPEVMLITKGFATISGSIEIEQGAVINTLGQGAAAYDSSKGFIYQPSNNSVVAVSNGRLQWLAPQKNDNGSPGPIRIGLCTAGGCTGTTRLYSEGSIAFATDNEFELDSAVRYGTRHLSLAVGAFNVGSTESLAAASARGALALGLALNQQVMDRLLQGDAESGAPALETLELIAGGSLNFLGSVTLSTLDADGKSRLSNLMLTTPAVYGYGGAGDTARIKTGHLIWNGAAGQPGAVVAGGAGTGSGTLDVQAKRMTFGYGPYGQPDGVSALDRQVLGFAKVNLAASERITANNKGSLAVYERQGEYVAGKGYQYSGGNLNIVTPLLTGEAGSVNKITAGGTITVTAPAAGAADAAGIQPLGAELSLAAGGALNLDTTVALPSGKLTLAAESDLVLGGGARLDLSGRSVTFFGDPGATQYSWGGDATLESRRGNIRQAADSIIDLSARNNQAGRLTAIALDEAAGLVDLQGHILGGASGHYNAGGTMVPYLAGGIELRAQRLSGAGSLDEQFAALNQRLNLGEVVGLRSFQLKQGSLTIGNDLKASQVEVSLDNGHLTVAGTVDASGERVGSIRLAAKQGLTLVGSAVLDAHGTQLRLDSHGQIIDSPNRAMVELNSGDGLLTLAEGARIDLRHGTDDARVKARPALYDGRERGTLDLYAPRIDGAGGGGTTGAATHGDIAIDASGRLDIRGARSIAVNAVQRYADAEYGKVKDANGLPVLDLSSDGRPYQVIDQDYLNRKHDDSTAFIDKALANADLLNRKLAGLNNASYRDAFHLRPAVEIVSATPDGAMVVSGDIDLSGYRYASLNPHVQKTGVYGSGEPGALAIRAGGNLSIYGSINDGFAPPPDSLDDKGWVLTPGVQGYGGDVVVPGPGVTLAEGTRFVGGKVLNYDLPIQALTLPAGTVVPVPATLNEALTLPAGTVLRAAVRDAAGNVLYPAGTVLRQGVTLPADTRLDAGSVLPAQAALKALAWPRGVPLPGLSVLLAGNLALPTGALIPSMTDVKLPDDALSVPLRTVNDGRMGRNWAVAAMLPEGSLSWSLRLVAGADIAAADTRIVRPGAEASLVLADTHYSLYEQREKTLVPGTPGTPAQPGGKWYWDALGAEVYGFEPNTPVPAELESACVDAGICVRVRYVWDGLGAEVYGFKPGTPVSDDLQSACMDPGICISLGEPTPEIPGTPDKWVTGEVIKVHPVAQNFSVLRTGTGDLDLIASGDVATHSLYGIYTAGTSAAFNHSGYTAWHPDGGGNLLLRAGGNLAGDLLGTYTPNGYPLGQELRSQRSNSSMGNWLWRQASGGTIGVDPIDTAWWINFGAYVLGAAVTNEEWALDDADRLAVAAIPELVGFTGIGTLGGGNVDVEVGGNAGMLSRRGGVGDRPRSEGLALAVGSTGRVTADGHLMLTGGGDLRLNIGNVNAGLQARAASGRGDPNAPVDNYSLQNPDVNGVLANLRGAVQVRAGELGGIALSYGLGAPDSRDIRAYDPNTASLGTATGGLVLKLGDAIATLDTRGDLVLAGSGDPGRVPLPYSLPFTFNGIPYPSGGHGWFSLWTENTAINLMSGGGDLAPVTPMAKAPEGMPRRDYDATDGRLVYPSQLQAVAAAGNVFLRGDSVLGQSLLLAPSANAKLSLLAGNSIYADGSVVSQSGASADALPTPLRPAFAAQQPADGLALQADNLADDAVFPELTWGGRYSLFAFGPDTAAAAIRKTIVPARLYARDGDILGLESGGTLAFIGGGRIGQTWYEGAGPVWMRAGRDIVRSGSVLGQISPFLPNELPLTSSGYGSGARTGNLFVHNNPTDVSIVEAGRDILYSSFDVAGPGTLEISAGRNILMAGQVGQTLQGVPVYGETAVRSIGPVVPGDARPGASIVMQAGLGSQGADYAGFLRRYLDPANLADAGASLASQPGKVPYVYSRKLSLADWLREAHGFTGEDKEAQTFLDKLQASRDADSSQPKRILPNDYREASQLHLVNWLEERFGYDGSEDALAVFNRLSPEQQRVYARGVYFAELKAGGREYNDTTSARQGSYLRGRNAITALFPSTDAQGRPITYKGDITMYGSAGVNTLFGGDIEMLTPGGSQIFGVEGKVPVPVTGVVPGVVTQGAGNIHLYALDDILLGQSRIMTTFGGHILAWSAEGDINAGRGSKTTVVYTPPKRAYDSWGNVTLSSDVPSTGAGIATLAPIAEVPAGDIDLIAPLGTIDAGEAGIRVSGNVNIAALHVVNAANIAVKGESSGIPTIAAVNVGALTNASAAASQASAAAQDVMQRDRASARQNLPSVFTVRVLGFGNEPVEEGKQAPPLPRAGMQSKAPIPYDPRSFVQIAAHGDAFDPAVMSKLSEAEQRELRRSK
ncbi:filamentous haemagglutinin family protein [Variovorax sp. LT1R16]|uniref:filamentous haemagglutinin family protein n=1 Tax=Variovorax sp. LT1R16 TaxID=3443728 RepID=UPI003F478881